MHTKWKVQLDKQLTISQSTDTIFNADSYCVTVEKGQTLTAVLQPQKRLTLTIVVHEQAQCVLRMKELPETTTLNLTITLLGDYSSCTFDGVVHTQTNNHHTFVVKVTHQGKQTESSVNIKALVEQKAQQSMKGLLVLEKGSLAANAQLTHRVLAVDETAIVISEPQLQVLHDAVSCGHATSVTFMQEEELFMLMSRGFSYEDAREQLQKAFLKQA